MSNTWCCGACSLVNNAVHNQCQACFTKRYISVKYQIPRFNLNSNANYSIESDIKQTYKNPQNQLESNNISNNPTTSMIKKNTTECNGNSIKNCTHLSRIMSLLTTYHTHDAKERDKFIHLCSNVFNLDDYIHLIHNHSHQRRLISDCFKTHICENINQCPWTQRHYRNRNKTYGDSNKYNFYLEVLDTLHFYLFHLEDIALRIPFDSKKIQQESKEKTVINVDEEIDFMQNQIEMKWKQYALHFNRLSSRNSKFILQQTEQNFVAQHLNVYVSDGDENKAADEITFIDEMLSKIQIIISKEMHVSKQVDDCILNNVIVFLQTEEYDTDSVILDIDITDADDGKCNIRNILYAQTNSAKIIQHIEQSLKDFIKYKNIACNSFSTGFCFFYHSFYKKSYMDSIEQQIKEEQIHSDQQNDFRGVTISNLYVPAHFHSLKAEVLNSSFIGIQQFNAKVVGKGNKYINTKTCKKIKCVHGKGKKK
eukprot:383958_1